MAKTPKRPIGFGREPVPNGTGDGFKWQTGEADVAEEPIEIPPRQPKADPVYVGTIEALEILAAYGLAPLAPLSNLEQQLVQVVAGLEARIKELE